MLPGAMLPGAMLPGGAALPGLGLLPAQEPSTTIRHKVEVDQRALVDKILARYATDFGALRELVQNADDAGASEVVVSLELSGGGGGDARPRSLRVWNNGRAFTEADWLRVRKIAAGNPDEASVGLFGVGFFSVFALTEAPEIHSGDVRLRFTWQNDNSDLVADESRLTPPQPGAAFVLPLKVLIPPLPLP